MIEGHFVIGIKALEECGMIRSLVFTEEQGVDPSIERDYYDHFAHHLIVKDGDQVIGTGRLILKDDQFIIGRIAVLPEERGQRIGDLIVRMLCARAFDMGAETITVHSQVQVMNFYKRIGFKTVSDVYQEANIDHVTMEAREKDLSHPCGSCNGC